MTAFWIVIAALLVLVSLALVLPLWRGEGKQSISRSALNKQLYRQRLLEIGEEREQGILAEESESLVELQRSLLDDIPDVEQSARGGKSLIWIPGVLVLVVVSLGLYYQLGAWQEVSRWQDASSRLGELSNRILVERDSNVTEQDLLDFTLGLRTRLKEEPNDYRGWLLLGRLTLDGNDPEMAREALERAYSLAPQKAMVAVQAELDARQSEVRVIMQVHDELVFELPEGESDWVRTEIPRLMAGVAELKVPLLAEVGVGPNWDKAH